MYGCHFTGYYSGVTNGMKDIHGNLLDGKFYCNSSPIMQCSGFLGSNAVFFQNSTDINFGTSSNVSYYGEFYGNGCGELTGATAVNILSGDYRSGVWIDNYMGVDGSFKGWSGGGIIVSQNTVMPTGYAIAYLHTLSNATTPNRYVRKFTVPAGESVNVELYLRKSASMTYLPRVFLMSGFINNPLTGATPVDTFTMTDSTDTWETDTFTIANTTDYDQDYTLWFVAQNANGNAYSAYDITTQGGTGGGGAVSIQPYSGRISL